MTVLYALIGVLAGSFWLLAWVYRRHGERLQASWCFLVGVCLVVAGTLAEVLS